MKKTSLTLSILLLFASNAWAENQKTNEETIQTTLLVCEELGNRGQRDISIEKLLKGKAKLPKEKKLRSIVEKEHSPLDKLGLNKFDVIKITSDSTSPSTVEVSSSNGGFLYGLRGVTLQGHVLSGETWDVETVQYRVMKKSESCADTYWRDLLLSQEIQVTPWYTRRWPADLDRWSAINRQTLVYYSARGCEAASSVRYSKRSQCYISSIEEIQGIKDALTKLRKQVEIIKKEKKEKLEAIKKEKLKKNKI